MPFIVIGFVAFSGVYYTYYEIFLADLEKMERKILKVEGNVKEELNHFITTNNENEKESYMTALKYTPTIILALCLFIELNTLSFYVPTLVNYLKDSFDLSTSKDSLFFLFSTKQNH